MLRNDKINPMNQTTTFLFFLFVFCNVGLFGQYYPLPEFSDQWPADTADPIEVLSQFQHHEAVILDDDLRVSVRGRKDEFMHVYFERKQRIKLLAPIQGNIPFSRIVLPESHDPFFDSREMPSGFPVDSITADYLEVRMVHFAARKILPDGSTKSIPFTNQFVKDTIEINQRFQNQFQYNFLLSDLQPGDEIEIHFKYEVPYSTNWLFLNSNRIFFHRNYPVQEQRVEIATPKHLSLELLGTKPDSVYTRSKRTSRIWYNRELAGCIAEKGINPTADLPHIVYSIHTKSPRYHYRHPQTNEWFGSNYVLSLLRYRERDAFWIRNRALDDNGDWQSHRLKQFVLGETDGLPGGEPALRFDKINTVIANDFKFVSDERFYAGKDMSLDKIGDQVTNKEMRESSRYHLYARIINLLGVQYFTAYMLDSRIGTISSQFPSNLYFSDFAFAVPDDKFLNMYFPKKDQFGYEVNEFPFYLAGTSAYLVDIDHLFFNSEFYPIVIGLPGAVEENYRHCDVKLMLNTEKDSAFGKMETELAGQFSTLTRSVYDFGRVDSSINPKYGHRLFWGTDVSYQRAEQALAGVYAPYLRRYNLEIALDSIGEKNADADYSLPLSGWFNFITWPEFDDKPRVLPFYPDFTGNDFVRIMINFDRAVSLQNAEELNVFEENRYGSVSFSVEQTASNQITLTAKHNTVSEQVAPDKISLIYNLYNSVESIEEMAIKLNWAASADN